MFNEIKASKLSIAKRRPVYGVGINDATYMTTGVVDGKAVSCPYYRKWIGIMERCYYQREKERSPCYIGCTVCNEWHSFSVFRKWMESQDWKGKELDKDILIEGNKVYSPKTCLFVGQHINKLFTNNKVRRGIYPIGVGYDASRSKYTSSCRVNGKTKNLGRYKTQQEAENAYITAKNAEVFRIANLQDNIIVRDALLQRIN